MNPAQLSPGMKIAYRIMLEEVRDLEIDIARKQCRVNLLRAGCHPQQQIVEAVLGLGYALHDTYGPGRASLMKGTDKP